MSRPIQNKCFILSHLLTCQSFKSEMSFDFNIFFVLAMTCGEVIDCSMSQEHFEGSVDMGDQACPFDGRRCADIHTKLLP